MKLLSKLKSDSRLLRMAVKDFWKINNSKGTILGRLYRNIEPKFPPIKILNNYYCKALGVIRRPRRYKYLLEIINKNKCKKIMEIGTWNGVRALQMIDEAEKNFAPHEIHYYGFDLFESMDSKTSSEEFTECFVPPTLEMVREKLVRTHATIQLYQGNTREVLPRVIGELPNVDLVFIDGGHSIETIKNDWKYVQTVMSEGTIVIFDDYYNRDDVGCKKVVESIDKMKFEVKVLPICDKSKIEGHMLKINFVQVRKKTS